MWQRVQPWMLLMVCVLVFAPVSPPRLWTLRQVGSNSSSNRGQSAAHVVGIAAAAPVPASFASGTAAAGTPPTPGVAPGPPSAPYYFDVVVPGDRPLGLQIDPDTLEVLTVSLSDELAIPGTISMVMAGDRLVWVNNKCLAWLPPAEATALLRTLATSGEPQVLRFESERSPYSRDRRAAFDYELQLNGDEALSLSVTSDLVVTGLTPHPTTGGVGQCNGLPVEPSDRIVAIDGRSMLQLMPQDALAAVRAAFVQQKTEEVRCRGPNLAVYCSVEQLPRSYTPRRVRFRPAPIGGFAARMAQLRRNGRVAFHRSGGVPAARRRGGGGSGGGVSMHGNPASSASATASDSVQLPPGSYGYDDDADMAYAVSILSASDSFSTTEGSLVVTSPRGNTTSFEFRAALFGGNFPCAPLRLRVADPLDGCAELQGASTAQFIGAAVLVRRGDCFFENKARMAAQAGAAAVIVYNAYAHDEVIRMPGGDADDIDVPAAMISFTAGQVARAAVTTARAVHHVATGAAGTAWVQFQAPGACPNVLGPPAAGTTPQQHKAATAVTAASAGTSEAADGALSSAPSSGLPSQEEPVQEWMLDSSDGASAFLDVLLAHQRDEDL